MDIEKIASPLRELLSQREIIARCELLIRTYDIVRSANLSEQDRKELGEMVGKRLAPGIFASIMSKEPVFFNLPKLDTYTQMNGRIFHFQHTKRYSKQDFASATRQFQRSLPELRALQQQCLADRLKDFMADAGYTLAGESGPELTFSAEKRIAKAFVVTNLKSLNIDKYKPEKGFDYIILVASSETVEPFMQFFREKGQAVEDKGLQIWIMNLEKGTIDPFIGYTTDLDIYNQFDNPRLAEMVRSNWSRRL
jgi:hypothetical protein